MIAHIIVQPVSCFNPGDARKINVEADSQIEIWNEEKKQYEYISCWRITYKMKLMIDNKIYEIKHFYFKNQ